MHNDPNMDQVRRLFGGGGWIGLSVLGTPLREMTTDDREAYLRQMVMGPPPMAHKPYGIMRPSIAQPPKAWTGKP